MATLFNQPGGNKKPGVITPDQMLTQDQFNEMIAHDMASIMTAYGTVREFCNNMGDHHNKLVTEFKKEISDLKERIAALEELTTFKSGVKSVTRSDDESSVMISHEAEEIIGHA